MVKVKVCGITNVNDGMACATMGADFIGFVFAPSPRRVTPEQARAVIDQLPVPVKTVGIFVNEDPEKIRQIRGFCGLDAVQLHGDESEDMVAELGGSVIKALRVGSHGEPDPNAYPNATLLLDAYCPQARGGTGTTFDWNLAAATAKRRRVILAGGLTPENVIEAVQTVHPYAVDVSSGVESAPGRKDHAKLERFIRRAKAHARRA